MEPTLSELLQQVLTRVEAKHKEVSLAYREVLDEMRDDVAYNDTGEDTDLKFYMMNLENVMTHLKDSLWKLK